MRRLLCHRWMLRDGLQAVDDSSTFDDNALDEEILTGMAIQLGWKRPELRQHLLDWKFNALTATYLLLLLRRSCGKNYTRMADVLPLKDFIHSE